MIDPAVIPRIPLPLASRPAQEIAPATPPPAVSAPEAVTPLNPNMRIDPALGIVVIEFRDNSGDLSNSFPTPRELKAYHEAAQAGLPLPGTTGAAPAAPATAPVASPGAEPAADLKL
jgi:hypothetical protein